MFTGIIEEKGSVQGIRRGEKSASLKIGCCEILSGTKLGDSICVNGVCLTVTAVAERCFEADVMPETMRGTNLGYLKPGDTINLERALSVGGRFGGHIVSGHIDGTGRIIEIKKEDNAVWITVAAKPDILRYIVHKGSVAVDGISLTVQYVDSRSFKVAVIPHTRDYTTLQDKKIGYIVNIECDIIGKYIERLVKFESSRMNQGMTLEYLMENGF